MGLQDPNYTLYSAHVLSVLYDPGWIVPTFLASPCLGPSREWQHLPRSSAMPMPMPMACQSFPTPGPCPTPLVRNSPAGKSGRPAWGLHVALGEITAHR